MSETQVAPSPEPTFQAPPKRAVLIVNTKSRRGKEWFDEASGRLKDLGIELESAQSFKTIQELIAEAKSAVERKVPLVIAGGGDGTFNAISRFFPNSESVLGVLPLGTGNAFARDLGIPAQLEVACRTIAEGKVEHVDMGVAGDRPFLNVATIGLTTKIAQTLTVDMKRKFGRFVYAIAIAKGLSKIKPFQVRLETDGRVEEFETLQLVIGNGRYHAGPFPLSPDATITEGRLTVYALATTNKMAFLKLATRLPTGHQGDLPEVRAFECATGKVSTVPPMPVTVDGEVCVRTPFDFRVQSRVLPVVVPQDFAG